MTDHQKVSLLIVEDQAESRKLIRVGLQTSGFVIHEASTGLEALAMVQRKKPDVVLLDLVLPGYLNGLDVCREIKGMEGMANTLVIVISGMGDQNDFEAAVGAGANAYFVKPFRLAAIALLIKQRHLLGQNFVLARSTDGLEKHQIHPWMAHAAA